MKTCSNSTCPNINPQPLNCFNKNPQTKDGLHSYCKICHSQKASAWNVKNKEQRIINQKQWYENNAEYAISKAKKWQKKNPQKVKKNVEHWRSENAEYYSRKNKDSKLKRKFGLSITEYDAMFAAQNSLCAICNKSEKAIDKRTNKPRALAVDHCHLTGNIRQLLCNRCNHVLGLIEDNLDMCDRIKEYLWQNKSKSGIKKLQ